MSTETLLKSTIKLNPEASKMLRNRMEELDNQAVCKHIYGVASEWDLEFIYDKDFECKFPFTYCPLCGKKL